MPSYSSEGIVKSEFGNVTADKEISATEERRVPTWSVTAEIKKR